MLVPESTIKELFDRLTGPEAGAYQPVASVEEAVDVGRSAGRRWVLELASVPEILHAAEQFNTGPQAFVAGFIDGINEILQPIEDRKQRQRQEKARAETVARRARERAERDSQEANAESPALPPDQGTPAEPKPEKPKVKAGRSRKPTEG